MGVLSIAVGALSIAASIYVATVQNGISRDIEQLKGGIERNQTVFTRRIEAQSLLIAETGAVHGWRQVSFDRRTWSLGEFESELRSMRERIAHTRGALANVYPVVPPRGRDYVRGALDALQNMDFAARSFQSDIVEQCQWKAASCNPSKREQQYTDNYSRLMDYQGQVADSMHQAIVVLQASIAEGSGDADFSNVDAAAVTWPPCVQSEQIPYCPL